MKISIAILISSLFLFLTACQSIDKPKGTSAGYESFRFIVVPSSVDGQYGKPTAEEDRLAQSAIRESFEAQGLTFSPDNADLVVGYLFIRQNNVSTTAIPTYYGLDAQKVQSYAHKKGVLKSDSLEYFEVGAIVIDVIDSNSGKLVYRNHATRDVMGVAGPDRMAMIEGAVNEALADFFKD